MLHLTAISLSPATLPIPQDPDNLRLGGAEIGGHQLLVEEGRWYTCNRLEVLPGPALPFVFLERASQAFYIQCGRPQGVLLAGYVRYAAGGKLL